VGGVLVQGGKKDLPSVEAALRLSGNCESREGYHRDGILTQFTAKFRQTMLTTQARPPLTHEGQGEATFRPGGANEDEMETIVTPFLAAFEEYKKRSGNRASQSKVFRHGIKQVLAY